MRSEVIARFDVFLSQQSLMHLFMDCYCRSKQLYRHELQTTVTVDGNQLSQERQIGSDTAKGHEQTINRILQASLTYLPASIQTVSFAQIVEHPLWFCQHFIANNIPCKISGIFAQLPQMQEICDRWKNPHDFLDDMSSKGMQQVSISITPDGFADSIKNQYFVEPEEIQAGFKDLLVWGAGNQKEKKTIRDEQIPYIQHQNSNLTEQLTALDQCLCHDTRDYFSSTFFGNRQPEAQNFWMGFPHSVSSLHKDPYQNFYSVLTGEKHFSLLPPISILHLREGEFINSKFRLNPHSMKLEVVSNQSRTRWISCNPDLKSEQEKFPELPSLASFNHHVVVEAGQMLYLPALWYHQVSQCNSKDSMYTCAINSWFDMDFNPSYSLYEAARALKGYP